MELLQMPTQQCPHCRSHSYIALWRCKDHMVSGEQFVVGRCAECGLLQTLSAPNAEELGRYYKSADYLSHQTKTGSLTARIYNRVRSYRIARKVRQVIRLYGGVPQQVLEIGAGVGLFAEALRKRGSTIYIVEQSGDARDQCVERLGASRCYASTRDLMESGAVAPHSLDMICLWHSLEHLPDLAYQLESFAQLLRPGGSLCIAVPNAQSFDAGYYRELWAAYDVPRHLWHFTPHTMQQTVEPYDFSMQRTIPMHLDLYYIALLSEEYRRSGRHRLRSWMSALGVGISYHIRSLFVPKHASALLYHFLHLPEQ